MPDGVSPVDSYGGREPTSHERMAGRPWDASYLDGPAPWDIGHPQPAIAPLASEGAFTGAVLDAGCGTGEHALLIAATGAHVLGVDVAETALAMAREKAVSRGLEAEFELADALRFDRLGRTFDTVLDCGLFHSFEGEERPAYVASLASVTRAGSTVYVLCFSDVEPAGPHPVSELELRAPFEDDGRWSVDSIAPASIETRFAPEGVAAWLARIERA
jgi:SAM-dependent methyltransferase